MLSLCSRRIVPFSRRIRSNFRFLSHDSNDDDKTNDNDEDAADKHEVENDDNNSKIIDSSNFSPATIIPTKPTKVGYGDEAPRMPHVLALPVTNRPLFPGVVTSVTLTEPATIDAIERMQMENNGNSVYISAFLRKKNPMGISEEGVILPTPEVITDPSDLYNVGCFAQIHRLTRGVGSGPTNDADGVDNDTESGSNDVGDDRSAGGNSKTGAPVASVLLLAHRRVNLISVDSLGPPIDVSIQHWPRLDYTGPMSAPDDTIRALINEILSTIREVSQINPLFRENVQFFSGRLDANDPYRLADFAASLCSSGVQSEDLQAVLEEKDPEMRLHKALVLLSKEREVSKLQQEIQSKVEEKMSESQRRYFLTEQLKSIKKELGMERDDKEAVIEKYRKQLAEYSDIPENVNKTIEAELDKLSTLEMNSSEYNVTRNYLDHLCGVPWNVVSEENFDIRDARKILNKDHYGLDDVKDAILEFIAVGKLKGNVQGQIICLAGPPGTGKTSIAKSVAEALGRKFFRFSVGGLSNVSEITGHRRTYVGAMPGKIIQALKKTRTFNPVILIDEIDKLGHSHQGDPASALLEVLDPSQNNSFVDHYLDEPVDISKVLFICTANEIERIPEPLLDRMEIIRLSGYDFLEKVSIAKNYLVPKSMKNNGLIVDTACEQATTTDNIDDLNDYEKIDSDTDCEKKLPQIPSDLEISNDAIESLVRWYAREAGVRNLSKYIDKITRKLALQIVAEDEGSSLSKKSTRKSDSFQISSANLEDYVGKHVFTSDRLYEKDPLPDGVVMGLAYTSNGGCALYIECQGIKRALDENGKFRGGGNLATTGNLKDVMKESTKIAYTVARARLADIDPNNDYFDKTDIHMHCPEGSTPKDGPSAGIAMVTSMLSLALGKPVRNDLAMTGEVSLTGKVLPVGGIKEKIMGGKRAGIKSIILPDANRRDYDEIPDYLKEGLTVYFAESYDSVYEVTLKNSNESC